MKILFFAPLPTKEKKADCPFITERILELQRQGHEVITLRSGNLYVIKNVLKSGRLGIVKAIYIFIMQFFRSSKSYCTQYGLIRYYDSLCFVSNKSFFRWFKKQRFNLIHSHFLWYAKMLPELKQEYNIPYVITLHGSDIQVTTPLDKGDVDIALNVLENASKCIFVSNFLLKHAMSLGYKGNNSTVIFNGYNESIFHLSPVKESNNEVILGFVGHTIYIKGVDMLPQVLNNVKKEYPNAKLIIIGSGADGVEQYTKLKVCQLGLIDDVVFIPEVSPECVGEYMREFSVLLVPSRCEGFSCVSLEAQACGVGVVASSSGGVGEAVGQNGICVPDSDTFITDYSRAIIDWLKQSHDRSLIAESVKNKTWRENVAKEIAVYEEVIKGNKT